MKKIRMISMDTSSTCTGYGYFENAIMQTVGALFSESKDNEERMDGMCKNIIGLLNEKRPHIVVAELTVVENNAHTQRLLSEILGVVRGWCIMHDAEFVTYRPNEWRALVADEGETIPVKRDDCKTWALAKARDMLGFDIQNDNVAEGFLIGIARINDFVRNDWEEI